MTLSKKELGRYARDHLLYEVEQLHDLTHRLLEVRAHDDEHGGRDLEYLDMATRNAQVESFAINARVLYDFLYETPQQDDVSAAHYMSGTWTPPRLTRGLEFVKARVNKEIAHLTAHRALLSDDERQWQYATVWTEMAAALSVFVDAASPELLPQAVAVRIQALTTSKSDLVASIELEHSGVALTATNTIYPLPETEGSFIPEPQPMDGEARRATATHRASVGPGTATYRVPDEDDEWPPKNC